MRAPTGCVVYEPVVAWRGAVEWLVVAVCKE